MKNKDHDIGLNGLSKLQSLFGDEEIADNYDIRMLRLEETYDFEKHTFLLEFEGDCKEITVEHPFEVSDDDEMEDLSESIREYGVLEPGICRPGRDGRYEVVSGHRRRRAAMLAGVTEMPFIIRDLSDEEATIIMVDSNKYRKNIKISAHAKAVYMKYCAVKRQGKRKDLIKDLEELETRSRENDLDLNDLASKEGMSLRNLQRFIRLANLTEEILQLVDQKVLGITPAVALSYLSRQEQSIFYNCILQLGTAKRPYIPTLEEANQLKRLSRDSEDGMQICDFLQVLLKDKDSETVREKKISFPKEKILSYFPESFEHKDIEKILFSLLEEWKRKNKPKDDIPLAGQADIGDYIEI